MRLVPLLFACLLVASPACAQVAATPATSGIVGDVAANGPGNDFTGFKDITLGLPVKRVEDLGFFCDHGPAIPSCVATIFRQRPQETYVTAASSAFGVRLVGVIVSFNSSIAVTNIILSIDEAQCPVALKNIRAEFGAGVDHPDGQTTWMKSNTRLDVIPGDKYCTIALGDI